MGARGAGSPRGRGSGAGAQTQRSTVHCGPPRGWRGLGAGARMYAPLTGLSGGLGTGTGFEISSEPVAMLKKISPALFDTLGCKTRVALAQDLAPTYLCTLRLYFFPRPVL